MNIVDRVIKEKINVKEDCDGSCTCNAWNTWNIKRGVVKEHE